MFGKCFWKFLGTPRYYYLYKRLYLVKLHRTCQVFTKKKSTTYNQIRDLRNFQKFSDQLFDCPPLKSCFQKRLTAVLAPEPQRNVIPSMILTRYVNFIIWHFVIITQLNQNINFYFANLVNSTCTIALKKNAIDIFSPN